MAVGEIVVASVLSRDTWVVRARPKRQQSHRSGTVLGPYRLGRLLGEGAAGLVYEATHEKLGRQVALKILREELSTNGAAVDRFFSEAKVVNAIAHRNIVEITDFVERDEENGTPSYYVMELLRGETLYDLLGRQRLNAKRTTTIGVQIASALAAAHEAGVVHRDLKPENIFVGPDDRVKLLDFGVAKLSTEAGLACVGTAAGALIGTPGYMAPEQTLDANVDSRADVYALGVLLFEMLTGRGPFLAQDTGDLLLQHREDDPPDPTSVALGETPIPRWLSKVVLRCLAKDPNERPADGGSIHEILTDHARSAVMKRRALAVGLATVAALAVVGLLLVSRAQPVVIPVVQPVEPPQAIRISEIRISPDAVVQLESEPSGATVFVDGEVIGQTPIKKTYPKSERPLRVRFELDGRQPSNQSVFVTRDQRIRVSLADAPKVEEARTVRRRSKARRRAQPEKEPTSISPAAVLNPFEVKR